MCVNCIRGQVDITEGIPKQLNVLYCKSCGRYLQPPKNWITAELESKELLAFFLKRMRGLNKVKLVDAGFVWTEPHSRRIKVKLTIQKEVFSGTILQQVFVVEFVVEYQQCEQCTAAQCEKTWKAVLQVRQKIDHKRTFLFLEQLILKHNAHSQTVNIKEQHDGIDFFFSHRSHALKMIDFLRSVVPIRYKASEHLISHDANSNSYNYQYSFSVEIAPVCKDDIICLPPKISSSLGSMGPLVICTKISNMIQIIDPRTLQGFDIPADVYWKNMSFQPLASQRTLIQYTVLDIEPHNNSFHQSHGGKFLLADATVVKTSDLGRNDAVFHTITHLGRLLKPGDLALGYHVAGSNFNDANLDTMSAASLPEVILVRKDYEQKRRKNRSRPWRLKHLNKENEEEDDNQHSRRRGEDKDKAQYERFLQELEEDPELRSHVNLYKDPKYIPIADPSNESLADIDEGGDAAPEVGLEELLDEMTLDDGPDPEDEEGEMEES